MNKKKLKKLALKGICGGLLVSAPGLAATQGSDAMANFTANSSGQTHGSYLAGGCGGGSCGGGSKKVAINESSCGAGNAQRYNQYADQYQPQGSYHGNQPQGSCNSSQSQGSYYGNQPQGSCNSIQPQGSCNSIQAQGYHNHNQNSNQYQSQSSCGNRRSNSNQISHADSDGIQVEYDDENAIPNGNRSGQMNSMPKRQGQIAAETMPRTTEIPRTIEAIPRSIDNPYDQQNPDSINRNSPGNMNRPINQANPGQINSAPRVQGQLATGAVPSTRKLTEMDLKAQLNPQTKADFEALSPEGKALALKMANQDCKGKNDCKGQNACKSKTNSCGGQGGCKGTAETNFKDKNMAVKVAKMKMAEKRNNAVSPTHTH